MIGVIEKAKIADLAPLGNGYFRGQGNYFNRQVRFVVRLTKEGRVLVCQTTSLPANLLMEVLS